MIIPLKNVILFLEIPPQVICIKRILEQKRAFALFIACACIIK